MLGEGANSDVRVLFATTHSYLPQRAGGSESSTHDLCLTLRERGIAVGVLTGLEAKGVIGLSNRIRRKIWGRIQYPVDHIMGYPAYRGWVPERGVDEVVQTFKPDVAITQAGPPIGFAERFAMAGVPTIVYLRDADPQFRQMVGRVHPNCRFAFVANSAYVASRFANDFNIQATVIPPLVRPERYRTGTDRSKVVFVNPCQLKGVEIAFRLAERRPDVPFEFVEAWTLSADMWARLRERAAKAGNITLRMRTLDMRRVYRHARIVLVPSLWEEPWARVVTEGHVSGIPVLASNRGGLPESVGPGGILVDADADISEWESALSRLWDNASEYAHFSAAAKQHSNRREIQPEYLIEQLLNVISRHAKSQV